MTAGYAGDVTSREAWRMLSENGSAVLVDVRTEPEWSFVGVPDLSGLGRQPLCISWQVYPSMAVNGRFADQVEEQGVPHEAPLLLLCRSGQRSRAAAVALTAHGFSRCYNVADGFEGPPDRNHRRGTLSGWKAAGLPWVQG